MYRDAAIEQAEARMDIEQACESLTRKQWEALALWLQGYTQEEIGERLGIRQQAISELLSVVFALLRGRLT